MVFFNKLLCITVLHLVSHALSSSIQGCYFTNSTTKHPQQKQQHFQDFKLETYIPGLCSHIFFTYANIKNDFSMDLLNPGDLKWGAGNKFYNQIIELKFQQPELKTILSIGGTCDFKDMVIDDDKRQKFVKSAADFVNLFNFDGVDIDISQPIKNRQDLTNLINELKEVLPEKLVTISVPTTLKRFDSVYDVPAIAAVVDFVNILTIPKSTSFIGGDLKSSNTFDEMYNWVSNGMSKDKLVVGMGINENISRNSNNSNDLFSDSITVKNQWMKENGFGGAFVHLKDFDNAKCSDAFDENHLNSDCCVFSDTDIDTNNLTAHSGQPGDCCDLCVILSPVCKAYVWNSHAGGTCWFKTAAGPAVGRTGYITGTIESCNKLKPTEKTKSKSEL